MSLELKIEKLTVAIEALTLAMNVTTTEVLAINSEVATLEADHATPAKPTPITTENPFTTDDIKAVCLELSRSVTGGKLLAKGILNAAGATKANDVKDADIASVMAKLQAEL